jgi:TolA-binding protein
MIYAAARQQFLSEYSTMETRLKEFYLRSGREDMNADTKRIYAARYRSMHCLATYFDSAEAQIADLQQEISDLNMSIRRLRQQVQDMKEASGETSVALQRHIPWREYLRLMNIVGNHEPKPIAAFLNAKEGQRQASKESAIATQPNLA